MEKIDIYNASLKRLGVKDRDAAHKEGDWHLTFHCWVVSNTRGGEILFQLRSPQAISFPNCFDVSAAGHLTSGENEKDGIREIREELGLEFEFDELHSLGYRVEVSDQDNGQKNREYQAVYILRNDAPLSEYKPQIEELNGLYRLSVEEGMKLFGGNVSSAKMTGIVYDKGKGEWDESSRIVSIKDFVPRIQNYYLTACIMAERVLSGTFPVSIS